MSDEDDTNPRRNRPASSMADNPSEYLREEPSAEARLLVTHLGVHQGERTPVWMLAELAVRLYRQGVWVDEMAGLFRRVRRWAIAAVTAVAINLIPFGVYMVHRSEESGAAAEREASQLRLFNEYRDGVRREFEMLHEDVRELRRELRRLSGLSPAPSPDSALYPLPDKFSLTEPLVLDLEPLTFTPKGFLPCLLSTEVY